MRELRPDGVLTDIRMPPSLTTDGFAAAPRVRAEHPGVGVVVLSQHAYSPYASALFAAGTGGLAYLLKDRIGDRDDLVRALRAVRDGGSGSNPRSSTPSWRPGGVPTGLLCGGLSARELDALRGMAEGRTNGAIAAHPHVSESAVSKHVAAVFSKLGLHESAQIDRRVAAVLTWAEHRGDRGH